MAASDPIVAPAGTAITSVLWDPLEALTGAWTDYGGSLLWTATGTNPAIVNGTISARYTRAGKLFVYTGRIQMGSSTTYGTGGWRVSLPVTLQNGGLHVGSAVAYDSGTPANARPLAVWAASTTELRFTSPSGDIEAAVPFTWASGDQLRWTIIGEVA